MAAREAEWEELASNQFFSFTFPENFDLNENSYIFCTWNSMEFSH